MHNMEQIQTASVIPQFQTTVPPPKTPTNLDRTASTFQQETITMCLNKIIRYQMLPFFLLKKDLLLSRLSQFCNKPDGYRVWKASFKKVIKELNVTPFEEFDLMIKWLEPESKKYAVNLGGTHGQSETCFAANLGVSQQSLWFARNAGGNDQKENQRFPQFDK